MAHGIDASFSGDVVLTRVDWAETKGAGILQPKGDVLLSGVLTITSFHMTSTSRQAKADYQDHIDRHSQYNHHFH